MTATSFALTCTAYQPTRRPVKVTGSLFKISRWRPTAITAASTPQRGPTSTRRSGAPRQRRSRSSSGGGSFPARARRCGPSRCGADRRRLSHVGKRSQIRGTRPGPSVRLDGTKIPASDVAKFSASASGHCDRPRIAVAHEPLLRMSREVSQPVRDVRFDGLDTGDVVRVETARRTARARGHRSP